MAGISSPCLLPGTPHCPLRGGSGQPWKCSLPICARNSGARRGKNQRLRRAKGKMLEGEAGRQWGVFSRFESFRDIPSAPNGHYLTITTTTTTTSFLHLTRRHGNNTFNEIMFVVLCFLFIHSLPQATPRKVIGRDVGPHGCRRISQATGIRAFVHVGHH